MSINAGQLLWSRLQFDVAASEVASSVNTGLIQNNLGFASSSADEPTLGVTEVDPGPVIGDATDTPSRIQVIPLMPVAAWANVFHSEPYVDPVTNAVHVTFYNTTGSVVTVNCLFVNPHTLIGPGEAVAYNPTDD
jgi:hypothetical protein